jgi:hypothetical protein
MGAISGHRMSLSPPRRFICDLMHASRHMPIITFERQVDISPVIEARKRLKQPPSWAILFAKGFAIVAARRPELRRTYLPLPWPHLWEAKASVAAIAVEREYCGEHAVFFGKIKTPNKKTLADLAVRVQEWKTLPLEEIALFRRVLRFSRLPLLLRRFLWSALSWSGRLKAQNFGTFGVSLTGSAGATATNLIGPVTTSLNCGIIQPDGRVDLRIHFDHRVLDGMSAARALEELENVLKNEIVAELGAMAEREPQPSIGNRFGKHSYAKG